MIVELTTIIFIGVAVYFGYDKLVADKLDCPANNEVIKGLEKSEIKTALKEHETKKKELDKEIKDLEKERKDILASDDADKADKAQEKLEEKNAKIEELKTIEINLADLKIVDKGSYWAKLPNKLTWNNGL
jgi:hypothetical protein